MFVKNASLSPKKLPVKKAIQSHVHQAYASHQSGVKEYPIEFSSISKFIYLKIIKIIPTAHQIRFCKRHNQIKL